MGCLRLRVIYNCNFQVCSEKANCSFAFNLCGEFAFEATPCFAAGLFDLLPKVDAVFGNASELRQFAEIAVREGRPGAEPLLQGGALGLSRGFVNVTPYKRSVYTAGTSKNTFNKTLQLT